MKLPVPDYRRQAQDGASRNEMPILVVPLDPTYLPIAGSQGGTCGVLGGQITLSVAPILRSLKDLFMRTRRSSISSANTSLSCSRGFALHVTTKNGFVKVKKLPKFFLFDTLSRPGSISSSKKSLIDPARVLFKNPDLKPSSGQQSLLLWPTTPLRVRRYNQGRSSVRRFGAACQ